MTQFASYKHARTVRNNLAIAACAQLLTVILLNKRNGDVRSHLSYKSMPISLMAALSRLFQAVKHAPCICIHKYFVFICSSTVDVSYFIIELRDLKRTEWLLMILFSYECLFSAKRKDSFNHLRISS